MKMKMIVREYNGETLKVLDAPKELDYVVPYSAWDLINETYPELNGKIYDIHLVEWVSDRKKAYCIGKAKELLTACGDMEIGFTNSIIDDINGNELDLVQAIKRLQRHDYNMAIACVAILQAGHYYAGQWQMPSHANVYSNWNDAKKILKGKRQLSILFAEDFYDSETEESEEWKSYSIYRF